MQTEKVNIISLQQGGQTIKGTMVLPEKLKHKNPGILFIHGWRSDSEGAVDRAISLSELGYISLTFDLPGHGASKGDIEKLTRRNFVDSTILAYDYLKNYRGVDADKISIVGASFGGYLASILTSERSASSLVLRAPANYNDGGFDDLPQVKYSKTYKHLGDKKLDYGETISLRAIHNYTRDILIIESERDEVIPRQTIENYINAANDNSKVTHRVIKEARHSLGEKYGQKFIEILKMWFENRF